MGKNSEPSRDSNLLPCGESGILVPSAIRFDSCTELYEKHQGLLKSLSRFYDQEEADEEFIQKVKVYIEKARETGVILNSEEERSLSQSVLNYWANILYSTRQEAAEAILARFDKLQAMQAISSNPIRKAGKIILRALPKQKDESEYSYVEENLQVTKPLSKSRSSHNSLFLNIIDILLFIGLLVAVGLWSNFAAQKILEFLNIN
jgi:hypothetical protein